MFTPLGQLWPLDVQQDQMAYLPPEQDDPSVTHAPPQRPWVDLTRTQIQDVYFAVLETHRGGHQMVGQLAFGEALQAAIKKKNA
jgi:hypothetical protein